MYKAFLIGLSSCLTHLYGGSCRRRARIPMNVILFISDGCGYAHIEAASLYQNGPVGQRAYERFPVRLAMSTYPVDGTVYDPAAAWTSFDYVTTGGTDSAAAATAMATGIKTYNGAINWDVGGKPLERFSRRKRKGRNPQGSSAVCSSVMPQALALLHTMPIAEITKRSHRR